MTAETAQMIAAGRPPSARIENASPDEQEARIRETDDEPVVPPQGLEQTTFVYRYFSHTASSQLAGS